MSSLELHRIKKKLRGRKIIDVRFLSDEEMSSLGWRHKSLMIFLDDGNYFFAAQDDEGADAGALYTSFHDLPIISMIGG